MSDAATNKKRHVVLVIGPKHIDKTYHVKHIIERLAPNKEVYYDFYGSFERSLCHYLDEPVIVFDATDTKTLNDKQLLDIIEGVPISLGESSTADPECIIFVSSGQPISWKLFDSSRILCDCICDAMTKICVVKKPDEYAEFENYADYYAWCKGSTKKEGFFKHKLVTFNSAEIKKIEADAAAAAAAAMTSTPNTKKRVAERDDEEEELPIAKRIKRAYLLQNTHLTRVKHQATFDIVRAVVHPEDVDKLSIMDGNKATTFGYEIQPYSEGFRLSPHIVESLKKHWTDLTDATRFAFLTTTGKQARWGNVDEKITITATQNIPTDFVKGFRRHTEVSFVLRDFSYSVHLNQDDTI
jgi:hypothetical protein